MKPEYLSQAFVRALAPLALSQCPLSQKHNTTNSLSLAPSSFSSADPNPFAKLPSDIPAPSRTDPSLAPGSAPNPHAHRGAFNTNLRMRVTRDATQDGTLSPAQQCPQPPVWSCTDQAASTSTCCVQQPGGVLLHVQLWDANPGIGLADSWGIHGLWPDLCNGGYDESTDGDGRAYSGAEISSAIAASGTGGQALLDFMNQVWLSNDESPEDFWAHEWKSHGVRISTLEPSCFSNYQTAQETPIFFETVVSLFRKLDTYTMLSSANILPSDTATYALTDLQSAVESASGYTPDFVCEDGALSQVQYYLSVQGPVQDGVFAQGNPTRSSTCPSEGISYPVKQLGGAGGQDARTGEGEEGEHRRHRHERGHHERDDEF